MPGDNVDAGLCSPRFAGLTDRLLLDCFILMLYVQRSYQKVYDSINCATTNYTYRGTIRGALFLTPLQ